MKGIILAGGRGTRLFPATRSVCKQLLPVYNKPMIYYPLSVLMLAQIRNILIITNPEDQGQFHRLLGDGSDWGINLQYAVQEKPRGLAEAFLIGEKFISNDSVCLILGDNIFYGQGFSPLLQKCSKLQDGAYVFGYPVKNPEQFGVVEFDKEQNVISIEEKPLHPRSKFAVTGLYFYDNDVVDISKSIEPSNRNELEITTVNQVYMKRKKLKISIMGRGYAWLDAGTFDSLIEASLFVQTIEHRQRFMIACLEEISLSNGWIDRDKLVQISTRLNSSTYGAYLRTIVADQID